MKLRARLKWGNLIKRDRLKFGEAFQKGCLRKFCSKKILQQLQKFSTNTKLSLWLDGERPAAQPFSGKVPLQLHGIPTPNIHLQVLKNYQNSVKSLFYKNKNQRKSVTTPIWAELGLSDAKFNVFTSLRTQYL
jgi:hypothetical protein